MDKRIGLGNFANAFPICNSLAASCIIIALIIIIIISMESPLRLCAVVASKTK